MKNIAQLLAAAGLALTLPWAVHADEHGDHPGASQPSTSRPSANSLPATASATVRNSVTIDNLQALAQKVGLKTQLDSSGQFPVLGVMSGNEAIAFINGIGCDNGSCQGFEIFSVTKDGALTPAIISVYNSDYSYTRLVQHRTKLLFEQQVFAGGGITDANIINNLAVFFQNMQHLSDVVQNPASAPKTGFSGVAASGALDGLLTNVAESRLFLTGAELEATARAVIASEGSR